MLKGRKKQNPRFRRTQPKQFFITKLPIIKSVWHKIVLARFVRNLAITFAAGITLTEALTLAGKACGHTDFARLIMEIRHQVNAGLQLHQVLASHHASPPLLVQMIKTGEESGMLEHMLHKIADFLEADIHQLFSQLSQGLEPLILVVLGVLIGGLVIGMYLPIFKLGSIL
jgi:type IV pilus assembly protein PilC